MKINRCFVLVLLVLAILTLGAAGASDNVTQSDDFGVENDLSDVSGEDIEEIPDSNNVSSVPLGTHIEAEDVVCDYNTPENLKITLRDENGKSLAGKEIIIRIDRAKFRDTTDVNGQIVKYFYKVAGNYTVNIAFEGDENYLASSATAKITVNRLESYIVADDIFIRCGENGSVVATLKDSQGFPLFGRMITISINGTEYTTMTDGKGQVSLNIDSASAGQIANISFGGDEGYLKASKTVRISLFRMSSMVTALNASQIVAGRRNSFVIGLFDMDNRRYVADRNITLFLNGNEYVRTTNATGQATFEFILAEGENVIAFSFGGDEWYCPSALALYVLPSKLDTQITIDNVHVTCIDGAEFSFALKDENGNALSNKSLTISMNGGSCELTTDDNGIVRMSEGLTVKTGIVKVSFAGDDAYKSSSLAAGIVVLKDTFRSINGKAFKCKVVFNVKNKKYMGKTNLKGFNSSSMKKRYRKNSLS